MIKIADAEAAFLTLCARRVLGFQRKAEALGETYHDIQPMTDLQCGYAAKLRFLPGPGGQYRPELLLGPASRQPNVDQSLPAALNVAAQVLGGPAYYHGDDEQGLRRFTLEKDR